MRKADNSAHSALLAVLVIYFGLTGVLAVSVFAAAALGYLVQP